MPERVGQGISLINRKEKEAESKIKRVGFNRHDDDADAQIK